MKVLIVEDEELAVKKLMKTLAAVDADAEVVGVADSIMTTVKWINENPLPDLILMDIELSDGQSFEIFNRVAIKCPVIFTTSYDEYALKAFKVNSIDYLLNVSGGNSSVMFVNFKSRMPIASPKNHPNKEE